MKTWWWAWSSILKVLKVTSLQCLYNISKKKLWMKFIMDFIKDKKFYKLDYWFLMKARHVQITQKGKLVKFLQYIKKKNRNSFCVLLWYKTFRYFTEFKTCLLLLVFANIPLVLILPWQSWFLVCCPGVLDWISLSCFLYFSPKQFSYLHNFSSAV